MAVIPSTNVNLATNIRDVLKAAGGIVSNDVTTFFKSAANINKWARYKPESFAKNFDLTDNDRYNNDHGFDTSSFGGNAMALSALLSLAKTGGTWKYILPTGGEKSPFRLGDFRGYNTEAKPPFDYSRVGSGYPTLVGYETTGTSFDIEFRIDRITDSSSLQLKDFGSFESVLNNSGSYFIAAEKNGTWIKSTNVSTGTSATSMYFPITFTSPGKWNCMFCIGQPDSMAGTSNIYDRTDCSIMPNGYFTFEYKKKAIYVNGIQVSPSDFSGANIGADSYNLNLGTSFMTIGVYLTEDTTTNISMQLQYGFTLHLMDDYGIVGEPMDIMDEDSNDYISYNSSQGTNNGTMYKYKEFNLQNFPQVTFLPDYYDWETLNLATKVRLVPKFNRLGGSDAGYLGDFGKDAYYDIQIR